MAATFAHLLEEKAKWCTARARVPYQPLQSGEEGPSTTSCALSWWPWTRARCEATAVADANTLGHEGQAKDGMGEPPMSYSGVAALKKLRAIPFYEEG